MGASISQLACVYSYDDVFLAAGELYSSHVYIHVQHTLKVQKIDVHACKFACLSLPLSCNCIIQTSQKVFSR